MQMSGKPRFGHCPRSIAMAKKAAKKKATKKKAAKKKAAKK